MKFFGAPSIVRKGESYSASARVIKISSSFLSVPNSDTEPTFHWIAPTSL